jgi:MFS family permease
MAIALVLLLSAVTFVSLKGARVLMTLFAIDLGAGPLATGFLFAFYGLLPALLVVHAGRIADRIGNRILMYVGFAAFACALTLPALVSSLPMLFIASPLIGITSMIFIVCTQNLIGTLSTAQTRTRNYSYYALTDSTGNVLGPVLVGFAIDGFGHPSTYYILAAIAAACLVIFHFSRYHIPARSGVGDVSARGSMTELLRIPALRNALLTNAAVMTGIDLYNVYMPLYTRGIGLSASQIGLIIGAFGAAGFLVRLLIPPVTARWGEHAMIAAAFVIACFAFVTIPFTESPWLLGAASFVVGLGLGCGQPLSMVLSFNAAPPGRSAEAIAMRMAVSYSAHVVIPSVFGALGTLIGIAPVFWTCAVMMGGGALLNRRSADSARHKSQGTSHKAQGSSSAQA